MLSDGRIIFGFRLTSRRTAPPTQASTVLFLVDGHDGDDDDKRDAGRG